MAAAGAAVRVGSTRQLRHGPAAAGNWPGSNWRSGYYGGYRGYGWGGGYWGARYGWGWYGWPLAYAGAYTWGYPYFYGAWSYPVDTTVYIQQESPALTYTPLPQAAPSANSFWYFCVDPAGYYPYVKSCNKSWMQVVPQNNPGSPVAPELAQ
jgi:hypothetical protein